MKKSLGYFVFGILFCFLVSPTYSLAATIYSNSATGNDTTGAGTSGNPYATFHKAYTSASANDTINLTGTFDWTNAGEAGDASGTGYTISKNLTIEGQGSGSTFIQAAGSANTADRGVFTIGSGRTVVIKNVTIRYGVTTSTETGGGITTSGTLTIQNSVISYNKYNSTDNNYGGGAIMLKHDASGTLNLSTSTISNNTFNGKYYGSGGIYAGQSNTINITASTFTGNVALSSNPTTFAYSYAEPSGAIGVFRFVTTSIINSTFSGNSTNSYGGAMQVYYPNSFKITNSTIANNTASAGAGGILFESVTDGYNLHLKNTILANNTGNGSANDFHVISASSGRITDNGYNIVENSTNKTWSGTGNITGEQGSLNLASSLADNGTTNGIQTLALSSGSVAIDVGNSTTHSSVAIPGVDARGGTRAGTVDIGAFEYNAGGITFDTTAPTFSSISVSTTTNTATITWATDENASSLVRFGPTSDFGSTTSETDTSVRVASHTISLSGLSTCTKYYYELQGKDASLNSGASALGNFWTAGCTGSATVSSTGVNNIAVATGGTLSEGNLTLTVPTSFTSASSSAIFQANQLNADGFFTTAGTPSGKNRAGDTVFNLKALTDATTTVSTFSSPLALSLSYSDDEITGLDESSLQIYRYDSSTWYSLSNCSVDQVANTVTCSTSNFSDFAIFGDTESSSSSENTNREGSRRRDISNLLATSKIEKVSSQAQIPESSGADTTFKFSKNLRAGMTDLDVKELQKFLNKKGFTVSNFGNGALGNESEYFGFATYNALVKFQNSHKEEILKPAGANKGTGIFGQATREFVNNIYKSF